MTRSWLVLVCSAFLLCSLLPPACSRAAAAGLPGPRDPLTFRDMGLYGGWNDYWLSDDCPFDFLIVQARVDSAGRVSAHGMQPDSEWGRWLKRARAKGKRIIADVWPTGWTHAADPAAAFKAGLDAFMRSVDESLLYCITLAEENIYWDGHLAVLRDVYAYAKSKYHVPVYQWYSPYASAPGFGWPQLPADGWLIDEYAHGGPSFEQFARAYAVHQLPVIQIVWAAPLMSDFDWGKAGDPAFDWQLAVCRKYGIPCAFFVWEGHGNVWGWSPDALPESKAVYRRAVEWSRRAASSDLKPYESLWDDGPPIAPLALNCALDQTVSFEENFLSGGGHVAAGAAIKGFRDLRWDGGPLELRPRRAGQASAMLLYPLQCQFPVGKLEVRVSGRTDPRLAGRIAVSVSPDGRTWTQARDLPASGNLVVSLARDPVFQSCRELRLRVVLSGRCKHVGEVPAAISAIKVTGAFRPPSAREIRIPVTPNVPMRWYADLADGSIAFTADVDNLQELEVGPGFIGTHGVAGVSNVVAVRQKFVCDGPANLRKVQSTNYADEANFAATNSLAISLDGTTILARQATSGAASGANLTLDLAQDPRFANVREFWVHLIMRSGSGIKTATTNRVTSLAIEGVGAP
jgi:hypothetical protein